MSQIVGIDRKIKREWMDALLDQLTKTNEEAELRRFLDKYLKEELPGKASRAKSVGIILKIWSGTTPQRSSLRDRAVAMLPRISGQERIWLHWGMAALTYPFFRDNAEVVGRLLSLQDDFTTSQVQTRILTAWGDRATCREAGQKLITTLVDWEVLRSTKTKGHFLLAHKMTASLPELEIWLLEALLAANSADEVEAQQLLRLPESFPFALTIGMPELRGYQGFNIHRQGLDMDMVALRKVRIESSKPLAVSPRHGKRQGYINFDVESKNPGREVGGRHSSATDAASPVKSPSPKSLSKRDTNSGASSSGDPRALPDPTEPMACEQEVARDQDSPLAAPLTECAEHLRSGHFFGCVAIAQTLLESVIRQIWKAKRKKRTKQEWSAARILEDLHRHKIISDELANELDKMFTDRDVFHRLRPGVESEHILLRELAQKRMMLLEHLERDFLGSSLQEGVSVPDHPDVWAILKGEPRIPKHSGSTRR